MDVVHHIVVVVDPLVDKEVHDDGLEFVMVADVAAAADDDETYLVVDIYDCNDYYDSTVMIVFHTPWLVVSRCY